MDVYDVAPFRITNGAVEIYQRHVCHYDSVIVHYDCIPTGVPQWRATVFFADSKGLNYARQIGLIDLAYAIGTKCNATPLELLQMARAMERSCSAGTDLYNHAFVRVERENKFHTAVVCSQFSTIGDDEADGLSALQWWITTVLQHIQAVDANEGAWPWVQ